jgi:hypothetical protein
MGYIGKKPTSVPLTSSDIADGIISTADLANTAVTGAKVNTDVISAQTALTAEPADTDEFLVSDAGVIKRIDYSLIKGGGGLVLLSHTTISSSTASAAFTSGIDSTYDAYKFVLSGVRPVTDDVDFHLLFSVDGGSSYLSGDYKYQVTARDSGGNTEDAGSDSASFIILTADDVGNESDESFNAEMVLYHPSNTAFHKQIAFQGVYYDHAALPNRLLGIGANSGSVAAVTGIKFQFASGNIAEGSFTMYGIAKA